MCVNPVLPLTIALVGGHGAGKTTVGRALAAALGAPYHEEVGRRLAAERRPSHQTAEDPQEAFDEAIFTEERARDAAWAFGEGTYGRVRVVETWHPGNLAYAARRSPAVVARHLAALSMLGPAVVLPVTVSAATAAARQNEPGDPAFFRAVGDASIEWARTLGLPVLPPVHNDGPLPLSVRQALRRLSTVLPTLELR